MPLTIASGGTADASIFTRLRTPGGGHDPFQTSADVGFREAESFMQEGHFS
jgi:hypothetical protein